MDQKNCVMPGCEGKAVPIANLFMHTLGTAPNTKPDFGEFVECQAWRCAACGHVQLRAAEGTVNIPLRRGQPLRQQEATSA